METGTVGAEAKLAHPCSSWVGDSGDCSLMKREGGISSHFIFWTGPLQSLLLDHLKAQSPPKTPANPNTRLYVMSSLNHPPSPQFQGAEKPPEEAPGQP